MTWAKTTSVQFSSMTAYKVEGVTPGHDKKGWCIFIQSQMHLERLY